MNQSMTKGIAKAMLFALVAFSFSIANAQTARPKTAVFDVDSKVPEVDAVSMGNMLRMELEKLSMYEVLDKYDAATLLDREKLNTKGCYGKICLLEVGKKLNQDFILTGTVEYFPETSISITLKLLNIKTETFDKTVVKDFLCFPKQLQPMMKVTLNELYALPNDKELVEALSKKTSYESATNNANTPTVNLGGPRIGMSMFTGESSRIMQLPKAEGGYNALPVLFQFGYQFEKQYVNEGNYQALFEFIPTITGFVSNIFIPNFTFLNGFRNNKYGLEIAFGPTFSFVKKAEGFYDSTSNWHLRNEWNTVHPAQGGTQIPAPTNWDTRLDSRGDVSFSTAFVIAFGKTFKSGRLNIPLNGFIIPSKSGWRFGLSFGFNAKKVQ